MPEHAIAPLIVPPELHQQRIDVVLARLFPQYSRSQLTQWLKQAIITVNQQILKPKDKVLAGDQIAFLCDPETLSPEIDRHFPENIPLDIVYEDESILILNKPAGLVVHPGAGNAQHTLVNALLHHAPSLEQLPRAGIVHRLDKDTTGLMVVAKSLTAQTALTRQMQARTIQRHYLTLVYGHIISGGDIDTYFGRDPRNRLKMAVCTQGRQAITHYSVKKHYQGLTLLEVKLETGRTHQIRVHMTYINHPVVGDPLYGGRARMPANLDAESRQALLDFKRQALHAYRLALTHPTSGKIIDFIAPLPPDFQMLINQLEKNLE